MSILQRAVEISATLDPSLGLELEMEFGDDWEKALAAAIEQNSESADPYKDMKADVAKLSKAEFRKKYELKDVRSFAKSLGIDIYHKDNLKNEAKLVTEIYKALDSVEE